jgi:hypothetical protein
MPPIESEGEYDEENEYEEEEVQEQVAQTEKVSDLNNNKKIEKLNEKLQDL